MNLCSPAVQHNNNLWQTLTAECPSLSCRYGLIDPIINFIFALIFKSGEKQEVFSELLPRSARIEALVLICCLTSERRKMLTKTAITLFLMLITFSVDGEGFAEGNVKASSDIWTTRIPTRLQGRHVSFRRFIVNGTPADIKDYPFKVSLRMFGEFFCGASIISSEWTLSAAHCLEWNISPDLVKKFPSFPLISHSNCGGCGRGKASRK